MRLVASLLVAILVAGCFGGGDKVEKKGDEAPVAGGDEGSDAPDPLAPQPPGGPTATGGGMAMDPGPDPVTARSQLLARTMKVGPNDRLELAAQNLSVFRLEFTADASPSESGASGWPLGFVMFPDDTPLRTAGACGDLTDSVLTYAFPGYAFDVHNDVPAGVYRVVLSGDNATMHIVFGDGSGATVAPEGVSYLKPAKRYLPVWSDADGGSARSDFDVTFEVAEPSFVLFWTFARPDQGAGENRLEATLGHGTGTECVQWTNTSAAAVALPEMGAINGATWLWGKAWTTQVGTHSFVGRYEWSQAMDFYRGLDLVVFPMAEI